MSGELRVTSAHLGELAAKQRQAAAEIRSATEITEGVDTSVRVSHGVISWSTAAAVEAANTARRTAGRAMECVSGQLRDSLQLAARRYDDTDDYAEGILGAQVQG
jgi:hypothetical protein